MTATQSITVSGSTKTSGPGVYYVTTPGVTITLETWTHWPDIARVIIVKDMTGSPTPNITVLAPPVPGGAIDGQGGVVITNQKEALVFRPFQGGITYGVTG